MKHSLINIVTRKNTAGESYYQARFFDKGGLLLTAKSYPGVQSRTDVYRLARKLLEEGEIPSLSDNKIKDYGILTTDEVRTILSIPIEGFEAARNKLVVLLGATCGLGVSEIIGLRFEDIIFEKDMLITRKPDSICIIPYMDVVRDLIKTCGNEYPDSRYVIANLKNIEKQCNPITIYRSLETILDYLKIPEERRITSSRLRETFINILLECDINVETIDNLCGFNHNIDKEAKIGTKEIRAITEMVILLKKLNYSPAMNMNWRPFSI
jgi:integrase